MAKKKGGTKGMKCVQHYGKGRKKGRCKKYAKSGSLGGSRRRRKRKR